MLPGLAYVALSLSAQMDWGFLLQKTGVLTIWFLAWAAIVTLSRGVQAARRSAARSPSRRSCSPATPGVRARERHATAASQFQQLAALSRYATFDASFRTLDDALADRPPTPRAFYEFLQANSNVRPAMPIAPRTIPLAPRITRADERPNVFLFVFDSLRPDYLSAYNAAVTFSPSLDALAAESLVFRQGVHAVRRHRTGAAVDLERHDAAAPAVRAAVRADEHAADRCSTATTTASWRATIRS